MSFDIAQVYCQHLESLYKDITERFEYILSLQVLQGIMNLFVNIEKANVQIQEDFADLSTNETSKASFQNSDHLTEFWLQGNICHLYPGLWNIVKNF